MLVILSSYSLSDSVLQRSNSLQATLRLTLSELRLMPRAQMIATLRGTRCDTARVVLAEQSERAVLPLMLTLLALVPATCIEVVDTQLGCTQRVPRWRAALSAADIVRATLTGLWSTARLHLLTRRLLGVEPARGAPLLRSQSKALYVKTNLMLGAKAGGSIGHIAGVANELHRCDADSRMLGIEFPPMVRPAMKFSPIPPLLRYGMPPEVNHFHFNFSCIKIASEVLRGERFDFIYQRLTLGNLSGVVLSREFGIPLVLEYNGSEVWVSQNWGHKLKFAKVALAVEDVCLRHAHRVVTVSQVLADELLARGVPAERIVWYPNCIDPEMFDPARHVETRQLLRTQLGIADDEMVVLFIGTFGLWHGAETLAEAARLALAAPAAAGLPRLRFVFVGDGLRLALVREQLAAEIARGDVILTGLVPQHEAPGYLAMADVFASPHVPSRDGSKFFGSPTKLFEYMAMGKPIIASDLDQLGQVLQPAVNERDMVDSWTPRGDETAVLAEPGSAAAIVRALQVLQRRPEVRAALSGAARRKALEQYTWRRHVDVIMDSLH